MSRASPNTHPGRSRNRKMMREISSFFIALVRNLHRVADALHGLYRRCTRAPGTFDEDLMNPLWARSKFSPAFAHRFERGVQRLRQLVLDFDVADLAGAVARFEIINFRGIRIEHVVVQEHGIAFDG